MKMLDENLQKKEYLKSYKAKKASVHALEHIVKVMEEEEAFCKNILSDNRLYEIHEKIEMVKDDLLIAIEEKNLTCRILLFEIHKMEQEDEKNVLLLKYINGYTWEQICEIMNYSLRQVYYIHNKALEHFLLHE